MANPTKAPEKVLREIRRFTRRVKPTVFATRDGEALIGSHFIPKEEKRGTILFLHGVDTSTSVVHYQILLHRLVKEGFEVYTYDQRGHGKTQADFDVNKMQDDVVDVLAQLKKRGITEVNLTGHSLGAVMVLGGLLQIARQKRTNEIPKIASAMFYAPPKKMQTLKRIKKVTRFLKTLDEKHPVLTPLTRVAASVYFPFMNPRLRMPGKFLHALRGLTGFRRIKADKIRLRDFRHFGQEIGKVPNFVNLVHKLKVRSALPPTLVFLGEHDDHIETHKPKLLESYKNELERFGARVSVIPFQHEPPVISIAGEKDMYDLADLFARYAGKMKP